MPAFQWPIDKLTLINSALVQLGDNVVAVADDGADEWNVASPAYERGLAMVCEDHDWSWLTNLRTLQPATNVPTDTQFDTAYDLPDDLVHLIWVRVSDRPTVWGLLNGQLVVNAQGGPPPPNPPTTPATVTVKGIFSTNSDITNATPLCVSALECFVMSGLYRGLHEDTGNANAMWQQAIAILDRARTRHDQQNPKRAMFNSRLSTSRRVRRPWPVTPPGWNGTGSPG
jgi:hypothetical protein